MKKNLKIALVEDNRFHAILFEQTVIEKYPNSTISNFSSGAELLKTLPSSLYDIICIDFHLPDMNGLELLDMIRGENTDVPVIFITGAGSEQIAVEAMKSGATDYITKSGDYSQAIPRVLKQAYHKQRLIIKNRKLEKRARSAEKLKTITTMTSTLNHEINNPLMAILGNIELLLENPAAADDSIQSKLEMISICARRIQSITRQMANLTTSETKETPVGPMLRLTREAEDAEPEFATPELESANKTN